MSISTSYNFLTILTPSRIHEQFLISKHNSTRQSKKFSPLFTSKNIANNPSPETRKEPAPPFDPNSVPFPDLNPLQKVIATTLDKVEKLVINMEKEKEPNRMVDPAIQLSGNHAPVQESPVRHDLEVVGNIPNSIQGVYVRNGGNPLFTPSSGHHFFDGDGMVHAVSFWGNNQASYSCRFTRTNRFMGDAALGKPVFVKPIGELQGQSGLARLALFFARTLAGLIQGARGIGVANVNLIYFNGRLLAMSEDDLPYNVHITKDGDLETIGQWDFDGQLKDALIAHPKVDPITGDFYSLSYNVLLKPYLKFFKFSKWGNKLCEVPISLKEPTMIHDFAITENYVVFPDHQLVFKLGEMMHGKSPVVHYPEKVTRFGVLPKDATCESMIQWINVPDWFGFHISNAWEEVNKNGDKVIVIINSCMTPAESIFSGCDDLLKSELCEIKLNLTTKESTRRVIVSGMNLEVGMVNKQLLGTKTRYVYLAIAEPWPKCGGIGKVDLDTGHVTKYFYGGQKFGGEPCFVPRDDDEEEDVEGFVMSFVRDEERETSELVILKASTMELIATVKIPTRVPYGFHGTFVSSQDLKKQISN